MTKIYLLSRFNIMTSRSRFWRVAGALCVVLPILFVVTFYAPLYSKRIDFDRVQNRSAINSQSSVTSATVPASTEFGLIIPKINVNVPVVADVNGDVARVYFQKLKDGVAHFKDTAKPNQIGNTVIFGHSSAIPGITATPHAETFLLLDKLKKGDQIIVYYQGQPYIYAVDSVKSKSDDSLDILEPTNISTLTLFTCWPPGTDFKRMVVVSHRV